MMSPLQIASPNSAAPLLHDSRWHSPNWKRLYLLLAGISLMTIVISITLTLGSVGLFLESAEATQTWAQRLSLHAELNAMLVVIVVVLGCGAGFQVIKLSRRLAVVSESQAELQRIKQSFEDANRARAEFLAQLSHDIRTPMSGILGMTALALDTELTEEQRSYLGEVKASAETLLNVITESCEFPALDNGPFDIETVELDLHEVIATAVKPQALRAHERGVELICHVAPDVRSGLVGDPTRLRQVLTSLVSSALKFTEQGEVVLDVQLERRTAQESWLRFAVRDTSGGLDADRQHAVAEALSGRATVPSSSEASAGLSLAIAAQLVARMGGNLRIQSVAGEGNTFYFTIGFGAPEAGAASNATVIPGSLKDLRVLVVDDSATERQVLHELLGHWNMRPMVESNGAAALAAMHAASDLHEPFGLVLVDGNMPGMSGFDVMREIARDPQLTRDRFGQSVRRRGLLPRAGHDPLGDQADPTIGFAQRHHHGSPLVPRIRGPRAPGK